VFVEEVLRIQSGVPQVFKRVAVELVRSALADCHHLAAMASPYSAEKLDVTILYSMMPSTPRAVPDRESRAATRLILQMAPSSVKLLDRGAPR